MATHTMSVKVRDDYLELVKRFPLAPIRNDRQLRAAHRMIDELSVMDEEKLTRGQADYLDVLADLTAKYEAQHHAVDLSHLDAVDTLNHLMEQQGMSASDLGRLLGNREVGSKILRRERNLSKTMIRQLADHFGVSPALFL
jgi:HTH-type transcriptional regulator/antitoxin HigA